MYLDECKCSYQLVIEKGKMRLMPDLNKNVFVHDDILIRICKMVLIKQPI